MNIRKYKSGDQSSVEDIHFKTGFLGKSMSKFLSDNKLYKKQIEFYFEKEADNIFVLEDNKKIIGYILGCLDNLNHNEAAKIIFMYLMNSIKNLFSPDGAYWRRQISNIFKIIFGQSGELKLKTPKNAGSFHINLLEKYRGKGYGTKLFKKFEKHTKTKGINEICASGFQTKVNSNTNFWYKNGFKVYSKGKSLIWKHEFPDEEIYIVSYHKKIK
jgi:GNAT superfamily N-acetyltransferase